MRRRRMMPEEDPSGISVAVRDFNGHHGPARVFYNRHSRTFFVNVYPIGSDGRFGEMAKGIDIVEVYRKTSAMPDVRITDDELRLMESEIPPYSTW